MLSKKMYPKYWKKDESGRWHKHWPPTSCGRSAGAPVWMYGWGRCKDKDLREVYSRYCVFYQCPAKIVRFGRRRGQVIEWWIFYG